MNRSVSTSQYRTSVRDKSFESVRFLNLCPQFGKIVVVCVVGISRDVMRYRWCNCWVALSYRYLSLTTRPKPKIPKAAWANALLSVTAEGPGGITGSCFGNLVASARTEISRPPAPGAP